MNHETVKPPHTAARGQDLRMAGASRDAALHDQLYRYAADLETMMERHSKLEDRNASLVDVCARLGERQELLDALMAGSTDMHIITDADGRVVQGNPATARLATLSHMAGQALSTWVHTEDCERFAHVLTQMREESAGGGTETELRLQPDRPDVPAIIVSARVMSLGHNRLDSGAALPAPPGPGLLWIFRDLTPLREIQFETQIATMAFRSSNEGLMITDVSGEILAVNPAFTRITGYALHELIGRTPAVLSSGMHGAQFYANFWSELRATGRWCGEIFNRRKTGEIYPEWLTVNAARGQDGQVLSYVAVFNDLSRILQSEKRLFYLAQFDTLTGLPNRLLLQDRLTQALANARWTAGTLGVLAMDIDDFKLINTGYGFKVGDAVLTEVALRIRQVVREVDTLARVGADEFVLLVPGLSHPQGLQAVANKIRTAIALPLAVVDPPLKVTVSLGGVRFPCHGGEGSVLLERAEWALSVAKVNGGNAIFVDDRPDIPTVADTQEKLLQACADGQLVIRYRTFAPDGNQTAVRVEPVVCWNHPEPGHDSSDTLPELAARVHPGGVLLRWALATACHELAQWDALGITNIVLEFPLDLDDLSDSELPDEVERVMASNRLAAQRLNVAIDEATLVQAENWQLENLLALRQRGIRFAIKGLGARLTGVAGLAMDAGDSLHLDAALSRHGCVAGREQLHSDTVNATELLKWVQRRESLQ